MIVSIALSTGAIVLLMVVTLVSSQRRKNQVLATRRLVLGLSTLDVILALAMVGLGVTWFIAPEVVLAAPLGQDQPAGDPYAALAAAIAVGLGSIGAGYAVSSTGSAAIGVIAEKPESFGRVLIFVGLAEGIAIYGLIVAFMVLGG